ncbi:probable G-protein coupled receptor 141 [Pleurodeles waltl]|uniref:probable G-protein coupled receptor 141 n=1 Tax=Pleurodeles waltl TaxID=8319 RepID=UPI0037097A6D
MEAVMAKMLLLSGVASGLTPAYHRHSKQYHPFQNSAYSPGAENAFSTSKDNTTACIMSEAEKKAMAVAMIVIYGVVLVGGVCGTTVMSLYLLRTSTRSVNRTMVINLLVVHAIFLLTVPFRITFYIRNEWTFGLDFCKIVSAMIHVHQYLSLIFYVTTLVSRSLTFFRKKDKVEFYRKLHAVAASMAVWVLVIVIIFPLLLSQYGKSVTQKTNLCFNFEVELTNPNVAILNYFIICITLTVVTVILCVQIFIVAKVVKQFKGQTLAHQEFWAQVRSLFFILGIVICFFPNHFFKLYYLRHIGDCRASFYNELFLSFTALSCLDSLSVVLSYCCKHHIMGSTVINKLACC